MIEKIQGRAGGDIRYPAVCLSFIVSLWASFNTGIINLDGILYIKMATQMMEGQWSYALAHPNLSFFSWLIMLVSKVTGLGLEMATYVLIASFSALLTYSFISILTLLTANRRILLWGALVIVFHPELIEAKHQILRDHGFWAFYMLGLYHFLRFYQTPSWQDSLLWAVWMGIGFLFRFEGLVLLCGLPLVLFIRPCWSMREKMTCFLQANVVSLLGISGLAVFVFMQGGLAFILPKFAHPLDYFNSLVAGVTGGLDAKAEVVAQQVLSHYADEFALPIVLLAPLVIIGGKILGGVTPIYAVLLGLGCRVRERVEWGILAAPLLWAGLLHICIYLLFTYAMFFIQGRYVIPLVLLLLLLVPFVFESLVVQWQERGAGVSLKKAGLGLVAVLILVNFLEGVVSTSDSKMYIKDAGVWLSENIDADASLFSNNGKVVYYSGRFSDSKKGRFGLDEKWFATPPSRDFYALWLKRRSSPGYGAVIEKFGPPLKEFSSDKKHRVLIYQAPLMKPNSPSQ
ncbi:MAG: glycosyltransferase family 39 protein [Desulfobulbaceae bacterium]|jgi:hypothetical protein|nr:glycosyltransferase family 39 protein [Desulfobulbaceae bacterium]